MRYRCFPLSYHDADGSLFIGDPGPEIVQAYSPKDAFLKYCEMAEWEFDDPSEVWDDHCVDEVSGVSLFDEDGETQLLVVAL